MSEQFIGKIIAGKYRVDSHLRDGVYFGRHSFTEKPVTLKILPAAAATDQELSARFTNDAKAASRISHPNFLGMTDFGTDQSGDLYAAFEGVEGETLTAALERAKQVPAAVGMDVAKQIAAGLSAGHNASLIHGNLNPDNVLVAYSPDGSKQVKVFNFGSENAMTGPLDFAYLSPEQCSGAEFPDARSDVYSLGVILYEMLAGELPFSGETAAEVMRKQSEEPSAPLSAFRDDVPGGIEPIVLKALSKDPELRFQTADEFADALELQGLNLGTEAASAPVNNLWKTAFVVLAGISLLSVFLIYATSSKQTDPTTELQSDANGQPVQPINPATGVEEQSLATMPGAITDLNGTNNNTMPGTLPGGDGYNAWANGGAPPPGAPIGAGGQTVTVPNGQSPFMADSGCIMQPSGLLLCPVPVTPTPTPKATPTPKSPPANANTSPAGTPTPEAKPLPKATPTPAKPATEKPKPTATKPPNADVSEFP
jgi:serine/threonine protein kinase